MNPYQILIPVICFYFQAAKDLLDNQGRDALRKAQERSRKFGEESEKMSNIAREARTLAEQ